MKIWYGYGSEHSMNLVMIGQFKDARKAEDAKTAIERLAKLATEEVNEGLMSAEGRSRRFTGNMLALLREVSVHTLTAVEVEQFAYDFRVNREDHRVILTTEESDFSAFLKLFIERGAKIEVYSAHDFPDPNYGRGARANS